MSSHQHIKSPFARALIITVLILPAIFPGSAWALTQEISIDADTAVHESAARSVSQIGRTTRRLAPFAGILPSGTPFLPSLLINTIDTSIWTHPSTDPAGIAYQASTGKLLISDIDVEEAPQTFWDGFNIFQSTLTGSLSGNCTTFTAAPLNPNSYNNFSDEPAGITINNSNNHIFFSDDNAKRIFEVAPGLDGAYCTSDDAVTYVPIGVPPFNVTDSEDLAYGQNKLYITSGADGSASIYEYDLGANGVLGGGDDSSGPLPNFGTSALGFSDVEGIAYNSAAGTLYILSTYGTDTYLGETTTGGTLLRAYDLSYLGSVHRSGLTIAPASGDPSTNNIYIVSRGEDNANTPNFNDGKIWEIDITSPVMPDLIFKDGFESNDFSRWTLATTNNGNLNVNASAALFGSYGMRAQINNTTGMDVMDENPTLESRYRGRFYFDPNSIVMTSGDIHIIFQGYSYSPYTGANPTTFRVDFRYFGGAYQVRGAILNDSAVTTNGSFFPITDGSHFIEVDWMAASSSVANNGYLTFWIDGVQMQNLPGIDNDTHHVDRVRLGPITGLDATTSGTYYFDAFESRRQSYIGPVVPPTVVSVLRADASPTSAASVNYTVTFSEAVTGVDLTDFTLAKTGAISGETVSGLSGSGTTYTVTVTTGTGDGTLRLDVLDNNSIMDNDSNFLDNGFTSGETYTIVEGADVDVEIGGNNQESYSILPGQSLSDDYGINGGPVLVSSTNGMEIFTSQRAIFGSSFNSIVGYPADQLTTDYWFTSYDDLGMITYLVIGNPHPTLTAQVDVYIGGIKRNATPYAIAPGQRIFPRYGINAGPVHVVSTNGVNIFTSERTKYLDSFNEVMGIPGDQLTTDYWFTSYDDLGMITYLVIGNPHATLTAEVDVYIAGVKKNTLPYSIAPGQRIFPRYAINGGPVRVVSTNGVDVFTSERSKFGQSFNEVLGYPADQLTTDYWFTSYDDASMITYLVIGNPDPTLTAEVDVYINGIKKNATPYVIAPGQRVFPRYAINQGPVHVVSTNGVDVFTSERTKYLSSFNEILGLPDNQLTTDYWFTSYDDLGMSTFLVIAAP